MSKRASNTKEILKSIGCDKIDLVRVVGEGYWYFCYDDVEANIFETKSVYTPRLNDMTLEQWTDIGKAFVDEINNKPKA